MSAFTDAEMAYLTEQTLGRLSTLGPTGHPHLRPVGFTYDPERDVIDIAGNDMGGSQKYRNVQADPRVSFVVDDLASTEPWRPRGIEVRGEAETIPADRPGAERIRINPQRVIGWGLDTDAFGPPMARTVNTHSVTDRTSSHVTMINAFTVPLEESGRFLERWQDNLAAMARHSGFRSAYMHQAIHDEAELRFVNVAKWNSEDELHEAYNSSEFREATDRIVQDPELHVTPRPAVYKVIQRAHPR